MTVLPALKKQFLMRCLIPSFKGFLEKEMEDFGLFLNQYALLCLEMAMYSQLPASKTKSMTSESSLISLS